jgi:predicted transcriptional regulator
MSIHNRQEKRNRRDHTLIVSNVLSCAIRGIGKTELMFKAGLNSSQIDKYLSELLNSELLEMYLEKKKPHYKTTGKGKIFLQKISTLRKLS